MILLLLSCTEPVPYEPNDTQEDTGWWSEVDTDTDADADSDTDADTDSDTDTDAAADYREPGPYSVSSSTGTATTSCSMALTTFTPDGGGEGPRVILAHGFARAPANVEGWAEQMASHGLEVVTPALCHASIWDSDHDANGEDLVALNQALGGGDVIYAGHSAGGLAAVLAASQDSDAVAVMGLDLTDADGLGEAAAKKLDVPAYGLLGEAGSCNSSGNGEAVYAKASEAIALRVTEADHCDFEDATDELCTWVCTGTNNQFDDAAIQQAIRGLSTAAVVHEAGLGEGLEGWWMPGEGPYEELLSSGAISEL